jgi:hypothetical protein
MIPELAEIEERRVALGVSVSALERAASIGVNHYHALRSGDHQPRPALTARLKLALQRFKLRLSCAEDREFAVAVAYRALIAMAARELGEDPASVHAQDPGRRATHNPAWMRAAEVRRLAVYLLNAGCGFTQTDTARAAGMTKQAVSLACRAIEDRRSDEAFERLVERLTASIVGEW